MLLWGQILRGDKVMRRWLIRVLIAPGLEQWMVKNMLTCAVAADHREVVDRFNARTDTREQAGRARWCLSQQHSIANTLLLDLLLNGLWKLLNEVSLHIFIALEAWERPLLRRVIRRSLVSCVTDRCVNLLNHWHWLVAAISNLHLNQRVGQAHGSQPRASRPQLSLLVLLDEVLRRIDHVIQETHRHLRFLGQPLVIHLAVFDES